MELQKVLNILSTFKNKTIAVIGDLMLDDYIIGSVDRISPEAPVPVLNVKKEIFSLGGAANVANNIRTLGCNVVCFGVIGNDTNGTRLIKELDNKNIKSSYIIRSEQTLTIVKKRILAENQQLLRIDWENKSSIAKELEQELLEKFKNNIKKFDAVILSDYDKGVLTSQVSSEIIKICRENKIIINIDPKPQNISNYIGATSITPNKKEATEMFDVSTNSDNFHLIGRELMKKLKLNNLLLTRSEEGLSLFEKNNIIDIPTIPGEVYDVTGAGDTVISVYTLANICGASLYEAAQIANIAAGIVIRKVGTSTVTVDEILDFYKNKEKI